MIDADEFDVVVDHLGALQRRDVVRPDAVHHPLSEGWRNETSCLCGTYGLIVRDGPIASAFGCILLALVESGGDRMSVDHRHARMVLFHVLHCIVRGLGTRMAQIENDPVLYHLIDHRPAPVRQSEVGSVVRGELSAPGTEDVILGQDHAANSHLPKSGYLA